MHALSWLFGNLIYCMAVWVRKQTDSPHLSIMLQVCSNLHYLLHRLRLEHYISIQYRSSKENIEGIMHYSRSFAYVTIAIISEWYGSVFSLFYLNEQLSFLHTQIACFWTSTDFPYQHTSCLYHSYWHNYLCWSIQVVDTQLTLLFHPNTDYTQSPIFLQSISPDDLPEDYYH